MVDVLQGSMEHPEQLIVIIAGASYVPYMIFLMIHGYVLETSTKPSILMNTLVAPLVPSGR